MPPPSNAQKGSKAGKLSGAPRDGRQSRSRNTTPSSIGGVGSLPTAMELDNESKYLELIMDPFPQTTYDSIVDPSFSSTIPDSKAIDEIISTVNGLLAIAEKRGIQCDRGMRELASQRKNKLEDERLDLEAIDRKEAEEMRRQAGGASSKFKKKSGAKREEKERPLTHGAHGLAPQDGSNLGGGPASSPHRPSASSKGGRATSREVSRSSSLSPVDNPSPAPARHAGKKAPPAPADNEDDLSSEEEHQPPPAPAIPHLMIFGDDPWNFPDPTVYEIKDVTPDMPDWEKKKIFSVSDYPHNDLHDLIPGTPPDEDFSNKKPVGNQVQANTFATHIEGYLRPFNDEDLAWLRERNNNPHDFLIPNRGKKHYRQIWDEEDGAVAPRRTDKSSANEARGTLEDLDENTAETDVVSIPPLSERLLSLLRPEHRPSAADAATNGAPEQSANADLDSMLGVDPTPLNPTTKYPPATQMPEANTEHWKKAVHPELSYPQLEERLKQEFRFAGFMPPDSDPDYDNGEDDEIAVRMRVLQARLKLVSAKNNARKAVLSEKLQEHLAYQEYSTIKEDLDSQVVSNFGKRTRSMGKKSKVKRPGGAGGGSHATAQGMARPGIGDATKTVMEKRKKWIGEISPVFNVEHFKVPRADDGETSIFKGPAFESALKKELAMQNDEIGEAEGEEE